MAIRYPIVPNNITVHLGKPDEAVRDVTVSFTEYSSKAKWSWLNFAMRSPVVMLMEPES